MGRVLPTGLYFSKTGPKTAKSAPSSAARPTSARRVARDPYRRASAPATIGPERSRIGGRNVIRTQMHSVGSAREGNVCAGVYQNTSIQFAVLCSQLDDFTGQDFEIVGAEVFLAQLDVVHAAAGGMRHGCE